MKAVFSDMEQFASGEDAKRRRIVEGAMKVFLAYGFQRTTMDDIARAAEVSRPALYLVFKNKTDIYRAITVFMLEQSTATFRRALTRDGPFGQRLARAIEEALLSMMENIVSSPHGAEVLDMKGSLAADLIAHWRDDFVGSLAGAIDAEAKQRGVDLDARGLTPRSLGEMLLDGLEGMKMRTHDTAEWRCGAQRLVRVVELVLQP